MDLVERLKEFSQTVPKRRASAINEVNTGSFLVEPFLRELGYDPNDPDDIEREHTADVGGRNRADYLLKQAGKEIMLVEIKKVGTDLNSWVSQLDGYFRNKENVKFGMLTNGIEYRFYTDIDKLNIMDAEPFLTLSMSRFDDSVALELRAFTKESFDLKRAKSCALRLKFRQALFKILEEEFRSPSIELVNLLIKKVRPDLNRVTKKVSRELAPIVEEVWLEYAKKKPDLKPTPSDPSPPTDEIPVFADYQGRRFEATLMIDDSMWLQREDNMLFDGKPMNHSVAAFEAVKKVDPSTKKWPTGWTFWRFIDSDTGEERPIKEIFEEVWTRNSTNGY